VSFETHEDECLLVHYADDRYYNGMSSNDAKDKTVLRNGIQSELLVYP
jgi:(2Fe-2S) ferredoxin